MSSDTLQALARQAASPDGFALFSDTRFFYATIGPFFWRRHGPDRRDADFGFRVMERHVNAARVCHGGMLMAVMDMQLGMASFQQPDLNGFVPTVSMASDFLRPVPLGAWVECSSRIVRRTRHLLFVDGEARADGDPCLRANGLLKVPNPDSQTWKSDQILED